MRYLFLVLALACAGCEIKPVGTNKTDNNDAEVKRLFTDQNGYTVYRFRDFSDYHYYVVPSGGMAIEDAPKKADTSQQTN